MGINSTSSIEKELKNSRERIFCERKDVAREAENRLRIAFERLNISYPDLPEIEVKFVDSPDQPELGRTYVDMRSAQVLFDSRFAAQAQEDVLVNKLREGGLEYPGMIQVLTHEAGHIALWSVLGNGKRPATRLLDEGWATLLEEAGSQEDFEATLKQRAREGFSSEPEIFERCLDFRKVILPEENLNGVEYIVGATILLWIRETFNNEIMLNALRATLALAERDDSVKQNNSDTQDGDERLENVLRQIFAPREIADVKRSYLEWLKK